MGLTSSAEEEEALSFYASSFRGLRSSSLLEKDNLISNRVWFIVYWLVRVTGHRTVFTWFGNVRSRGGFSASDLDSHVSNAGNRDITC